MAAPGTHPTKHHQIIPHIDTIQRHSIAKALSSIASKSLNQIYLPTHILTLRTETLKYKAFLHVSSIIGELLLISTKTG